MSLLKIDNLTMTFDGIMALKDVTFAVPEGSIFGLIGPNGAGKTTLLNCLSRVYTPQKGRILFDGQNVLGRPIHRITDLGICRTFQNLELFRQASVRENILVGCLPHFRVNLLAELFDLRVARRITVRAKEEVDSIINDLGLNYCADLKVTSLPFGIQKKVELARALAGKPRLLLLDEPAAGMNPEESSQLANTIRNLLEQRGITILLVEHDMPLVMGICEQIVVLDHGEKICEGLPEKVRCDPEVIRAYLGEDTDHA